MLPAPKDDGKRKLPTINIPKDMTIDNYYGMNLLSGTRIGEETRQRYLDKLSELHVNGYLTLEEFEKRADWVNSAQTTEQIEIAFTDLQRSLLSVKINEYLKDNKPVKSNTSKSWLIGPFILYTVILICMTIDALSGAFWGVGILGAEMLAATAIIFYKQGKRSGRS